MDGYCSLKLLFCLLLLIVNIVGISAQIELRKDSSFSPMYYGALYGKIANDSTWYPVCYDSTLDSIDAYAICKSWGFAENFYAGFSSVTSNGVYMIRNLNCPSSTNNVTNLKDCTYSPTISPCTSGKMVRIRCDDTISKNGAARGIWIGSIWGGDREYFLRQLPNNQLQVRRIFTQSWSNIKMSLAASSFSTYFPRATTAGSICYWLGYAQSTGDFFSAPTSAPLVTSTFGLKNLYCSGSTATSIDSCSFIDTFDNASTYSYDELWTAVAAVDCSAAGATYSSTVSSYGLPMASPSSSDYSSASLLRVRVLRDVVVVMRPYYSAGSYASATPYAMCSDAADYTTQQKLCEWAGYGQNAAVNPSFLYTFYGSVLWSSLSCPAYAQSINDCTKQTASWCPNTGSYLALYCSSTNPAGSYSPPASAMPKPSSFPVAAVVIPLIVVVAAVVIRFYQRAKAQKAKDAAFNFSSTHSSAPSSSSSIPSSSSPYSNAGDFSVNSTNKEMELTTWSASSATSVQPNPYGVNMMQSYAVPSASPGAVTFNNNNNNNAGAYSPMMTGGSWAPPGSEYGGMPIGFGFGFYPSVPPPPPPPQI